MDYLLGLYTSSHHYDLTYYAYSLSPSGTENKTSELYSNSNVFAGINYYYLENCSIQLKYLLPVNPDWLQGYELKVAWEF
jgi:hypothetical protein